MLLFDSEAAMREITGKRLNEPLPIIPFEEINPKTSLTKSDQEQLEKIHLQGMTLLFNKELLTCIASFCCHL